MFDTKSAAAKSSSALEERREVTRESDSTDRRRARIRVTANSLAMLQTSEAIFDELWEQNAGAAQTGRPPLRS
jgi:DNA-binding MarR family transcriptional regulator